jgi:NAD(P)-dependent dehydrogenase (short-subunit alcohol dehydrogenase family)
MAIAGQAWEFGLGEPQKVVQITMAFLEGQPVGRDLVSPQVGVLVNNGAMQTPEELFDLRGKVAVITGGSRGIGRAIADGLASAGADVVIASRKLDSCEAAAGEIAAATGRRAMPVACHVGRWEDCDNLVEAVYSEYGRCDVLVNNAGMSPAYADLPSVSEDLYDKVQAINTKGPFRLSALIGTRMAEGDGGSIINVSSVGSMRPTPTDLPYAMAKAALNALTLGLAGVWAPKVRANLVLPSATETDLTRGWPEEVKTRIAAGNPMKRMGRPEDVVGACIFLASDAASYVNGAQIPVDGGLYRTL